MHSVCGAQPSVKLWGRIISSLHSSATAKLLIIHLCAFLQREVHKSVRNRDSWRPSKYFISKNDSAESMAFQSFLST
jgi:hypothetical protein